MFSRFTFWLLTLFNKTYTIDNVILHFEYCLHSIKVYYRDNKKYYVDGKRWYGDENHFAKKFCCRC